MKRDDRQIRHFAEHLLHSGVGALSEHERRSLARIARRIQASNTDPNANLLSEEGITFGERLSDRVAEFGGSWKFIILFSFVLVAWAVLNTEVLRNEAFDPYPYVFLNLVLSMTAALQAPIIMMSQNRQAARDRLTMIRDFEVNLKSEASIADLHKRFDHLTWQVLSDLDQIKRSLRVAEGAESAAPAAAPQAGAGAERTS
ncbi:DUF1003 domain-containing protein [Uliginosibacterium sediminicola]|uniref:DUF1003 domain-containing protein n=1 Tax=Uliginosibacterium sediminicola TaxID=2024550 RepID=A0ABU9Z3W2_9RHOO